MRYTNLCFTYFLHNRERWVWCHSEQQE